MFAHVDFILTLLCLFIGAWSITFFHQKSKRFVDNGLKFLFLAMVMANALLLRLFFFKYFKRNKLFLYISDYIDRVFDVDMFLRTLAILALYFFIFKALSSVFERKIPSWIFPTLSVGLFLFFGLYKIALHYPDYSPFELEYLTFWYPYRWTPNIVGIIWTLILLKKDSSIKKGDHAILAKRLAHFFLVYAFLELLITALFYFNFYRLHDIVDRLTVAYLSLFLVFWLIKYYIPCLGSLGKIITQEIDLDTLQKRFSLTKRELEILNFIIDGKSYKQIEEHLYISLNTVKRHIYNLYQKMNVNSRHQLVHLVSTMKQETQ